MMAKIPASVVVITKNEEKNIEKCLHSVQRFAEVFVIDSGSEDRTCEIAERLGAKVVQFRWNGKYPKKKQWCLENLPFSYDWLLIVDADEEVYPELADEIAGLMARGLDASGYFVECDYVFMGKVLKHGHRIHKLVLFDRRKGRFLDYDDLDVANMWEVEGHYQPHIDGPVLKLRNCMLHNDHNSLFQYFERHNRYSDWEAVVRTKGLLDNPQESQLPLRALMKRLFSKLPFKGVATFVYTYIMMLGFLDGKAGFHFAIARALYNWQIGIKMKEV